MTQESKRESKMRWLPWRPLTTKTEIEGAAAYRIRMVRNGKPVLIPRFLAEDARGIIAIGESGQFENRRHQFCRALERGDGHSEGNLLWWLSSNTKLSRTFHNAGFQYRVCAVPSKEDARALEASEIRRYVSRFGEVPPLNSSSHRLGASSAQGYGLAHGS